VEDLQKRWSSSALGGISQSSEAWCEFIVASRKLAREADTLGCHMRAAGQDQADTLHSAPVVVDFRSGHGPVVISGPRRHRRHYDVVAKAQPVRKAERFKQSRFHDRHFSSLLVGWIEPISSNEADR
jgi:hypothetical protein